MTERDKFEGAEGAEDYEFAAGELDDICREGLPPISDWMKKELDKRSRDATLEDAKEFLCTQLQLQWSDIKEFVNIKLNLYQMSNERSSIVRLVNNISKTVYQELYSILGGQFSMNQVPSDFTITQKQREAASENDAVKTALDKVLEPFIIAFINAFRNTDIYRDNCSHYLQESIRIYGREDGFSDDEQIDMYLDDYFRKALPRWLKELKEIDEQS